MKHLLTVTTQYVTDQVAEPSMVLICWQLSENESKTNTQHLHQAYILQPIYVHNTCYGICPNMLMCIISMPTPCIYINSILRATLSRSNALWHRVTAHYLSTSDPELLL